MKRSKRLLAGVLAMALVFNNLSTVAFADDAPAVEPPVVTEQADPGTQSAVEETPLAGGPAQDDAKEPVIIEEDATPLAGSIVENCCILHLLLLLLALAVSVYYTHDRKKHQQREFELRTRAENL